MALQAMLQPQLCNDTLIHAVSAALAILVQVDELGGKKGMSQTMYTGENTARLRPEDLRTKLRQVKRRQSQAFFLQLASTGY